ncbi:FAD-dependent oxidoreductase [Lusitaniella coriacea LEGE 07157]|uniref:FAD-dependent oxidoreductase n=1 Tax=Lusitaniella coriacea LEGE 07157 TaxID=945747 RepID=A0A8J7DNQ7_9CYAN|nr:NAD(P)/FAD-dependent oxidoreductase [Lusitaniella coriacea]MBE9115014.1 FAD-dependent oxidoreductase [Lusitaniella coriacea LEGE 07157]
MSSISFLAACRVQKQEQSELNIRTIIVGAGISGLAAARSLNSAGADVIVLEAKSYVGGRIQTNRTLGDAFEIGAGWIHGPQGNPISTLAKQIDAETFVTDDDSLRVYGKNGKLISEDVLEELGNRFEALLEQVDDEVDEEDLISLREALSNIDPTSLEDPLIYWALTAFTEFDTGGSIEELSAAYFDEDDAFEGDDVILINGYDRVLETLAEGLDIRLNTIVTAIKYGSEGVTITTNTGEVAGDYVICTVSLGVLKSNKIAFEPALPKSYQQSIENIPMGNVTKVALQFPKAFWSLDTQYFGFQSEEKGKWSYFMNYRTFRDRAILVAFSFGAYASKIELQSDEAIQAEVMDILKVMFGDNIPQPEQIIITRWSQDPYTLGAYSFTGTHTHPKDFERLAQPVEDRLFFAGEHTIFKYHGTTHGAYLSGIAAADEIIALHG